MERTDSIPPWRGEAMLGQAKVRRNRRRRFRPLGSAYCLKPPRLAVARLSLTKSWQIGATIGARVLSCVIMQYLDQTMKNPAAYVYLFVMRSLRLCYASGLHARIARRLSMEVCIFRSYSCNDWRRLL